MLTAHHIIKSYGLHTVLNDISFNISTRERLGLIGPNGCGKTTLMRILAGLDKPDQGSLARTRSDLRIGYLAQGFEFSEGQTIGASLGLLAPDGSYLSTEMLEKELSALALALAQTPGDTALQASYDASLSQLQSSETEPAAVLGPLGLGGFPWIRPSAT